MIGRSIIKKKVYEREWAKGEVSDVNKHERLSSIAFRIKFN
jgi:hypothetical protein